MSSFRTSLVALVVAFAVTAPTVRSVEQDPTTIESLGDDALTYDLEAAGHRNGRLSHSVLIEVESGSGQPCLLESTAAIAWELLVLTAEAEGVTGFAPGWCYRSVAQQQATYDRNCKWVQPPTPLPPPTLESGEQPPPPPRPPAKLVCSVPTAKPGTSNHGWGRAIDVVDTTSRRRVLQCGDSQQQWLAEHGDRFGWVLPSWARCGGSRAEPWHFEWAGVTVDRTVLVLLLREAKGLELPR